MAISISLFGVFCVFFTKTRTTTTRLHVLGEVGKFAVYGFIECFDSPSRPVLYHIWYRPSPCCE